MREKIHALVEDHWKLWQKGVRESALPTLMRVQQKSLQQPPPYLAGHVRRIPCALELSRKQFHSQVCSAGRQDAVAVIILIHMNRQAPSHERGPCGRTKLERIVRLKTHATFCQGVKRGCMHFWVVVPWHIMVSKIISNHYDYVRQLRLLVVIIICSRHN